MKTNQTHHYKVIVERGRDGYFVGRVPLIPGCLTHGKNYEELLTNIKEAIQLCLEVAADDPEYQNSIHEGQTTPTFIGIEEVVVGV
jgi:predicted RNase H-like HicB family nuclease